MARYFEGQLDTDVAQEDHIDVMRALESTREVKILERETGAFPALSPGKDVILNEVPSLATTINENEISADTQNLLRVDEQPPRLTKISIGLSEESTVIQSKPKAQQHAANASPNKKKESTV